MPRRRQNAIKKIKHRRCFLNSIGRKTRNWKKAKEDFERANPGKKFPVPDPRSDTKK